VKSYDEVFVVVMMVTLSISLGIKAAVSSPFEQAEDLFYWIPVGLKLL
jgi:hypothetical protein